MSLRDLVDSDCGGANALLRMGSHFAQDVAHKEDGISRRFEGGPSYGRDQIHSGSAGADQLVNEFLGASGPMHPPQTFRMDTLLQEMREIDAQKFHSPIRVPAVMDNIKNETSWTEEFYSNSNHRFEPLRAIMPGKNNDPMHSSGQPFIGNIQTISANDFFSDIPQVRTFDVLKHTIF